MEDFNNYREDSGNVVSGVEQAKKGKGGLIAGITAGVVLVGAGGGAVAYATSDYVKNQVKLATSTPESYYTWVIEKNTNDIAKEISEKYRKSIEDMKSGQNGTVSLTYELSNDARDILLEDVSDDEPEIIEIIKNINDVTIGVNAKAKSNQLNGNFFTKLNGNDITTFDFAADSKSLDVFFRCAELTEQWIDLEVFDFIDSFIYEEDEAEAFKKYVESPESILSPEELETEITKYTNVWNECISDVQLEKKADVAISDITVNYTITTVEISKEKAVEIAQKFVDTAKEDEILKGIFVDKLGYITLDEYNERLDEIIDDMNPERTTDEVLTLNTYIDPTGCIRGVSFDFKGEKEEYNDSIKYIVGQNGDEIRGEFYETDGSDDEFRCSLTAKENGNKYTGVIDYIDDYGDKYSVEFTDVELVDKEKCFVNGLVTLILPADEEIPPMSFSFNSDGASQQVAFPVNVDDVYYGKLTLSISSDIGADITMPEKSGAFIINSDTDAEITDYVEREKMETYINNVLVRFGLSDEYAKECAESIVDDMYYSYNYDDPYDWDDYGWDSDWDEDITEATTEAEIEEQTEETDPFEKDIVTPEDGQAYLAVCDYNFESMYQSGWIENLAYNATVADITGDGTYTVKVTADSDGYRHAMNGKKPYGIGMLALAVDGLEGSEDAGMTVTSIKIDGKEMPIIQQPELGNEDNSLFLFLYYAFNEEMEEEIKCAIDAKDIEEWTDIEATFEIKGMK